MLITQVFDNIKTGTTPFYQGMARSWQVAASYSKSSSGESLPLDPEALTKLHREHLC
jgi:hypothetical protein